MRKTAFFEPFFNHAIIRLPLIRIKKFWCQINPNDLFSYNNNLLLNDFFSLPKLLTILKYGMKTKNKLVSSRDDANEDLKDLIKLQQYFSKMISISIFMNSL